jgi:RNA polymerase sigma-70 factor (ECF subfamily)
VAAQTSAEFAPRPFDQVLREHQAMVFSIAYHYLRDRSAAEEVAQDVFLQLHRRFDDFKPGPDRDRHLLHWLRKVASHRSIDAARKRRTQPATGLGVALDDAPPQSVAGEPKDFLLQQRLETLIGSLPEKPRMVMVLRYQEDLMPEEIASLLDMPVRTVKSHLQRSLAMLREKIDRSMGEIR